MPEWTHTPNGSWSGALWPGSDIPVSVTRTPNTRFELIVTVGAKNPTSETMALPIPPTTHIIEETRYSNVFQPRCGQCYVGQPTGDTLTIARPSDEVIVPRSESLEQKYGGSRPHYSWESIVSSGQEGAFLYQNLSPEDYSKKYRPFDLYLPVSVGTPEHPTSYCINAMLRVKVKVSVPIGSTSSGREPPSPLSPCKVP